MKMYKVITALFTTVLLFCSCDDYLDIQPKGELIPQTTADYEAMLNYAQIVKASASYPIYMTDDAYLPDKAENDMAPGLNTVETSVYNLYSFQKQVFGESESDKLWVDSYSRIYYYNVIINNVMNSTEGSEAKRKAVKAEALAGRAFEYLNLVNAYGKHYDANTAATDLGVPLILNENIAQTNLTRATVKEVYDQILTDLQEAEGSLPEKPLPNAYRASKAMGLGMLARTYLYMGNYSKALAYADRSLAVNNSLLDFKQYSVVNVYAAIGRTNLPNGADNKENIYIRLAPYVYGVSGKVYGSDDLLSMYSDSDKRLQLYFSDSMYGISLAHKLWMPWLMANMAMSAPEMYLIAAECEARVGSKDKALDWLNRLRNNRIENNVPLTAGTADEVLKEVLDERRREFPLQGLVRLIDLKRLNKEARFAKTVTHIVAGTNVTLQPNDAKYVLPIPARVLRFNPNMPDNER